MSEEKKELPTRETIRTWVEKDLNASLAFLNLVKSTPGLLDKISNEIYDHVKAGIPKID